MKYLDGLTLLLIVVGGLNWGLVAINEYDLVAQIFGGMEFGETNTGSRIIYGLVGISALYWLARVPSMFGSRSKSSSRERQPAAS
jgi:uncharacterized protein